VNVVKVHKVTVTDNYHDIISYDPRKEVSQSNSKCRNLLMKARNQSVKLSLALEPTLTNLRFCYKRMLLLSLQTLSWAI